MSVTHVEPKCNEDCVSDRYREQMRESQEAIIAARGVVSSINAALDKALASLKEFGECPFEDLERGDSDA